MDQAAGMLGVSRRTVYNWIRAGRLRRSGRSAAFAAGAARVVAADGRRAATVSAGPAATQQSARSNCHVARPGRRHRFRRLARRLSHAIRRRRLGHVFGSSSRWLVAILAVSPRSAQAAGHRARLSADLSEHLSRGLGRTGRRHRDGRPRTGSRRWRRATASRRSGGCEPARSSGWTPGSWTRSARIRRSTTCRATCRCTRRWR